MNQMARPAQTAIDRVGQIAGLLLHPRAARLRVDPGDGHAGGRGPRAAPARSPNLNAFAERFVRTIKESCLDRLVLIGEGSLRRAVREFVEHYHHERHHQGLGNRLILPPATPGSRDGPIPYCARTRSTPSDGLILRWTLAGSRRS